MTKLERRTPAAHPWWRKVLDALGRAGTALAVLFVLYGFVVESNRSKESKRDAARAKVTADRVGALGRQNQALLAQIQSGRRLSITAVCRTSNEERRASRAILRRFHIPSENGLRPINCAQLLAQSNADSELP